MKKIINSYLVKFDTFSGFNNAFYVNKLYLINNNLFLNQPINNTQSPLIQEDGMKGYVIENIIIKKKKKIKKKLKKKYKTK